MEPFSLYRPPYTCVTSCIWGLPGSCRQLPGSPDLRCGPCIAGRAKNPPCLRCRWILVQHLRSGCSKPMRTRLCIGTEENPPKAALFTRFLAQMHRNWMKIADIGPMYGGLKEEEDNMRISRHTCFSRCSWSTLTMCAGGWHEVQQKHRSGVL